MEYNEVLNKFCIKQNIPEKNDAAKLDKVYFSQTRKENEAVQNKFPKLKEQTQTKSPTSN